MGAVLSVGPWPHDGHLWGHCPAGWMLPPAWDPAGWVLVLVTVPVLVLGAAGLAAGGSQPAPRCSQGVGAAGEKRGREMQLLQRFIVWCCGFKCSVQDFHIVQVQSDTDRQRRVREEVTAQHVVPEKTNSPFPVSEP